MELRTGTTHLGSHWDRDVCEAWESGERVGVASVDRWGGMHFNVVGNHRRKGVCTRMVAQLIERNPDAIFNNNPAYKGAGILSQDGLAFVKGFRHVG